VYCKRARDRKREQILHLSAAREQLVQEASLALGADVVELLLASANMLARTLFNSPSTLREERSLGGPRMHSRRSRRKQNTDCFAVALGRAFIECAMAVGGGVAGHDQLQRAAIVLGAVRVQAAWDNGVRIFASLARDLAKKMPRMLVERITEESAEGRVTVLVAARQAWEPLSSVLDLLPWLDRDEVADHAHALLGGLLQLLQPEPSHAQAHGAAAADADGVWAMVPGEPVDEGLGQEHPAIAGEPMVHEPPNDEWSSQLLFGEPMVHGPPNDEWSSQLLFGEPMVHGPPNDEWYSQLLFGEPMVHEPPNDEWSSPAQFDLLTWLDSELPDLSL
jgi:hypothetical protein